MKTFILCLFFGNCGATVFAWSGAWTHCNNH